MASFTIQESRKLVMPLETVLEALVHFDAKSQGPLSRGEVLQAEVIRDARHGDRIDVAVRSGTEPVVDWVPYNLLTVAAAIISYCRSKRIPLPYSGVKSLEILRDGVTFHIENTVSIARRPAVREDIAGQTLRYAKGYEPHAIRPTTENETYV